MIKLRKSFPMFVAKSELHGGLNQVILRFLVLFLPPSLFLAFGSNFSLWLNPLASSAAWYGTAASSNTSSFEDLEDNLWLMFFGAFLWIGGGWLESLCM